MTSKKLINTLKDARVCVGMLAYDANYDANIRAYALNLKLDLDKAIKQLERKERK